MTVAAANNKRKNVKSSNQLASTVGTASALVTPRHSPASGDSSRNNLSKYNQKAGYEASALVPLWHSSEQCGQSKRQELKCIAASTLATRRCSAVSDRCAKQCGKSRSSSGGSATPQDCVASGDLALANDRCNECKNQLSTGGNSRAGAWTPAMLVITVCYAIKGLEGQTTNNNLTSETVRKKLFLWLCCSTPN